MKRLSKGLITCLIAGEYTVYDLEIKTYFKGKPRGVFRIQDDAPKVGDNVEYEKTSDGKITITKIYPRKTNLIRPAIANIEQAFIVFSVKEPEMNLNLLDRFLTILEFARIKTIIVFNKWDLLEDQDLEEIQKILKYYEGLGYETMTTSAKLKLVDQLDPAITGHISVITGQSGVGKSSLLNVIEPELEITTREISKALNRGKHTTRHVQLINLRGGWIADTPGFGMMDFIDMSEVDVSQSFREFFEAGQNCKYNGCLHLNEPKCAVKHLVDNGTIIKSRYDNYLGFIEEIKKRKKW